MVTDTHYSAGAETKGSDPIDVCEHEVSPALASAVPISDHVFETHPVRHLKRIYCVTGKANDGRTLLVSRRFRPMKLSFGSCRKPAKIAEPEKVLAYWLCLCG
jgi:hypothetical protein